MEEKKKTNIIALTDFSEYGNSAVQYAASLSKVFQSTLTVISHFSFSYHSKPTADVPMPEHLKNAIALYMNSDDVVWDTAHYDLRRLMAISESANSIMFVLGVSRKKKSSFFNRKHAIRFIKSSRLPVMTVGKKLPTADIWENVMMPIDIDRQSKEKALWAGYFHRFGGATVHVLHTVFKDEFLKLKLADNIAFTEKLYNNLEIKYQLHEIKPTIDDMDAYSLRFAPQINASLTVIMMTKYYTLIDLIIGTKEKQIIANKEEIPVLCINERDDLYVLCT